MHKQSIAQIKKAIAGLEALKNSEALTVDAVKTINWNTVENQISELKQSLVILETKK
jgi:hypothetical protein